jgi:hypothetical protein
MSSITNPAAALAAAEQSLVAAVNQLAAALQGVASGPLDAALLSLKREAEAARERISGAREFAALCVSEVLASLAGLTADLSPEPAALPQPPAEEPAIDLTEEHVAPDEEPARDVSDEIAQPAREWPEASLPPEGPLTRAAVDAGRGATPSPNGRKRKVRR